jgi:Mg-chelatase subunit ChlD
MARKRATTNANPTPASETQAPRGSSTAPNLLSLPQSRFTLYNLMGQPRAHYFVERSELTREPEQPGSRTVAHSILIIDRSGSMYGVIEDTKDTLIKLLTLEEYNNFNLLVTLISYSGSGDVTVHFERSPIAEIMKRGSKEIGEIKKIRATALTSPSQALRLADNMIRDGELTAITLHTDGYANDPSPNSENKAIDELCENWGGKSVFVNTIAYSDYSDFKLLNKIANSVSGVCIKAGSIREVYDTMNATAQLLGGKLVPPLEIPLEKSYDYQVFLSHAAGKINGTSGTLKIRGLKAEDDAAIYKYRKLDPTEYAKLKEVPEAQTSEAVLAFARTMLAEGNLNTAKYAVASMFDKTLLDRHSRALTNLQVASMAQDLDQALVNAGTMNEHEILNEVPVNRKPALLQVIKILADHRDGFEIHFGHLRDNYVRRGLRRVQGTRDADGKLIEPSLKTEFAEKDDYVRAGSFDINRNTANLNVLIPRKVRLVKRDTGELIENVAGISLENLSNFNNYTIVGDGELCVRTLVLRISEKRLFDVLKEHEILEVEGKPASKHSKTTDYTLRLDLLPLVPPFEGTVNLDGVFDSLAELKVLSSVCSAHLKEESDTLTPEQVEALKAHYLSKNLFLNFPTTTEYTDLQAALADGSVDTRTSYKIDIGSRTILNLSKLHSANKFLERMYEVLDEKGQKIDKAKFEDCLEGVRYQHKTLSARTKVTQIDNFMKRLFDDFLGLAPNGSAVKILQSVGANDLAAIVEARGKGTQPTRAAFVKALAAAGKALDRAADELFNERVSPLVFYIGSTGTLPDEIDTKAQTADQIVAKYPDLSPSKDESDGMFYEIGNTILTVFAKMEYFSRAKTVTGGANVAPPQ